jgi:hypothetical protein
MTSDGHIGHAAEFECQSDEEAILHAEDQRGLQAVELWSGARLVTKLPGRPATR